MEKSGYFVIGQKNLRTLKSLGKERKFAPIVCRKYLYFAPEVRITKVLFPPHWRLLLMEGMLSKKAYSFRKFSTSGVISIVKIKNL